MLNDHLASYALRQAITHREWPNTCNRTPGSRLPTSSSNSCTNTSQFGLSPVSRSRVSVAPAARAKPWAGSKFEGPIGQKPWIPADEFLRPR